MNALIDPMPSKQSSRKFKELMRLYTENYRQLRLLFDDVSLERQRLISEVPGQLPLYFEVLEQHRYTTIARITHILDNGEGGQSLDPDAHIRIYHDAEMAEATHCYPGRINRPLFGTWAPTSDLIQKRWRTNRFLDRWLEYLLHLGHGLGTMRALDENFRIEASRQHRRDAELIVVE